jgi:hypothetical protein
LLCALPAAVEANQRKQLAPAPPISWLYFSLIRDDTDLPKQKDIQDQPDDPEFLALEQFLLQAGKHDDQVFQEAAFPYSHPDDPSVVRAQVFRVTGKLYRVRQVLPLPQSVIVKVYEGLIAPDPGLGTAPFRVLFFDLPQGVKLGQNLNVPVSFCGYYYKRYAAKVPAAEGDQSVDAKGPILIGRTLTREEPKVEAGTQPPPIPPEVLNALRKADDSGLPAPGSAEFDAFQQVLILAGKTDDKVFQQAAQTDFNLEKLFNKPDVVRGQVFRVRGRLYRLQELDIPGDVRSRTGLTKLYLGFIASEEALKPGPFAVIFFDLPAGVKPGKDLNHLVEFSGYYYKRYSAKVGKSSDDDSVEAVQGPLLIGRAITLTTPPASGPSMSDWLQTLLPILLGIIIGTALLLVGLSLWFRRHDAQVRRRIDAARAAGQFENFAEPSPQAPPLATPVQTVPLAKPVEPAAPPRGDPAAHALPSSNGSAATSRPADPETGGSVSGTS